jgi:hypothetical protein
MFAKSSEVGIFSSSMHNASLLFIIQSLQEENWHLYIFQNAFSFHGALFHPWRFISFMALYSSCIALSVPA